MAHDMQNSSKEEDLKKLLKLTQIPNNLRTDKEQKEMDRLNDRYKLSAPLTAAELNKKLQNKPGLFAIQVYSPANGAVMSQEYATAFCSRPGQPKPTPKNGMLTISFQSAENAVAFFSRQASLGRKFRVLYGGKVIATSNGKGIVLDAAGGRFGEEDLPIPNRNKRGPQQNPRSTPLMTSPRPTSSIKPTTALTSRPPTSTPQSKNKPILQHQVKSVPDQELPRDTPEIKHSAPHLTPFKRTPYD